MLKNRKNNDTITLEMRWNMMNQNVLVSTAMISTLWEKHNKDSLDVMLPFVKYAISKNTRVGQKVDISLVVTTFKNEFGYLTIPENVIITMLNRMCPTVLTRKDREYTLRTSLDEEYTKFVEKRTLCKERRNEVGLALSDHLNATVVSAKPFTCESAISALIEFFVANGLTVVQTPDQLSLTKKDDAGKINYSVARFLVDEHKKGTVLFDYITDMVKGFFVSSAISFQPDNHSLPNSKFKDLHCYLDTRVIIDALGLRLHSGQRAAKEFLEMLQSEGATLCCFEHTIAEIRTILRAYKNSLLNPESKTIHNTLERWDEQNVSVEYVLQYISLLEEKIKSLGIKPVSAPSFKKDKLKGFLGKKFISLLKHVRYGSLTARKHDEDSVFAVVRLRNGKSSPDLEKCGHIFATTNAPLVGVVKECLPDSAYGVEPVIADTTLTAVVWFKCSRSHGDYPVHKLIDNAMAALEPTPSFLSDFYATIDMFEAEGGISSNEAAIIRTDIQIRRDAVNEVYGDSSRLQINTIAKMKEALRSRYANDDRLASEENYQLYLAEKARKQKALDQIICQIETFGTLWEQRSVSFLIRAVKIVLAVFLLVFIGFTIAAIVRDKDYWIGSFIILIPTFLGYYDSLAGRNKIINKYIKRISFWIADKARAKKRTSYASVIDTLTENDDNH